MTLLEKAKSVDRANISNLPKDELIELAVAWFRGDVGYVAILKAMYPNVKTHANSRAYTVLATTLRNAIVDGKIKIEVNETNNKL